MLSGLGNASHLKSLGIEPVLDLPDVGGNLHDRTSMLLSRLHAPLTLFRLRYNALLEAQTS